MMGGIKRDWARSNSTLTTAGSSTVYTLTYAQADAAYYDGYEFSFLVDETCGAAPTLNINGLGARQIRKFTGGAYANIVAGDIVANQQLRVRYNLADTTFDILSSSAAASTPGWQIFGTVNAAAVANVDFIGIPETINHLQVVFDWAPSVDGVSMLMQTYDAAGNLDTGASDYAYVVALTSTAGTAGGGDDTFSSMVMTGVGVTVDNSASFGIGGIVNLSDIQASRVTKATWSVAFLDSAGAATIAGAGSGWRSEADRITGLRFSFTSGTGTGKFTLFAST